MGETGLVLTVGAEPTRMTAAMELARFGVRVRLVNKLLAPPTVHQLHLMREDEKR